jgi:hypothetical protein
MVRDPFQISRVGRARLAKEVATVKKLLGTRILAVLGAVAAVFLAAGANVKY